MSDLCFDISREQAATRLMESISEEGVAIANLLKAEAALIHHSVKKEVCCPCFIDIIKMVNTTIHHLIELQIQLRCRLAEIAAQTDGEC